MSQVLVNIGCGATWHSDWINLDLCPTDPQVTEWNASKGLPFGNELVDACYASHVLEHVTPHQARALLGECYRVLRYGGIVRLAVPDLEGLSANTCARLSVLRLAIELRPRSISG